MLDILHPLIAVTERGLLYSLIVIAVYLTSRIIKFDDLTVEGSFGLGGAVCAAGLIAGLHPLFVIPIVACAGGIAGFTTGILHTKLKINNLISGIVVTTGLFSITLSIAGSNASIMGIHTLFDLMPRTFGHTTTLVTLVMITLFVSYVIKKLLKSEIGFLMQASGDNPQMLTNLGKNINRYKVATLVIANMITALAGALFVQYVGYFSIWAHVGILVSSLAGLILAELVHSSFGISLLFGSILYQLIIAITFELHIAQEWNKLITAICIVILLSLKSLTTHNSGR